jgi:hypothetical protein
MDERSLLYIYRYVRLICGTNKFWMIYIRKHQYDHAKCIAVQTFKTILFKRKTSIGLRYYHRHDNNNSTTMIMCRYEVNVVG